MSRRARALMGAALVRVVVRQIRGFYSEPANDNPPYNRGSRRTSMSRSLSWQP